MRNKLITVLLLVGVCGFALWAATSLFKNEDSESYVLGNFSSGGVVDAQIVGNGPGAAAVPVVNGNKVAQAANPASFGKFPAVWQRDKNQYTDENEWRTWAASACSAASLSSVLNGYGVPVRISDVLAYLQQQNAIKAGAGLYRYDVFTSIGQKYGLRTVYSENKDVDAHFEQVLNYLRQGYPVVLNILDSTYFPAGHFVVATGLNADGTVAVMNPDPTGGKSVNQNWPADGLKLYFSRMARSAAFMPTR